MIHQLAQVLCEFSAPSALSLPVAHIPPHEHEDIHGRRVGIGRSIVETLEVAASRWERNSGCGPNVRMHMCFSPWSWCCNVEYAHPSCIRAVDARRRRLALLASWERPKFVLDGGGRGRTCVGAAQIYRSCLPVLRGHSHRPSRSSWNTRWLLRGRDTARARAQPRDVTMTLVTVGHTVPFRPYVQVTRHKGLGTSESSRCHSHK